MKLGCLIAPTAADIRDVMVEGQSGLLAVAPPWCRPRFEPSKRRVQWPNGALRGLLERGRARAARRGLNVDTLWADELACWQCAESTWDLAMLSAGRHQSSADRLPCRGKIELVRLDPAAGARSSLGPAAYSEYEQVFGSRFVARWPRHLVLDGLETLDLLLESGNLLIHPRCSRLKDAFQTYSRQRRGGEWIDYPADGHPEEDMIDALRGGVRDAFPEGLVPSPTSAGSMLRGSWDEPRPSAANQARNPKSETQEDRPLMFTNEPRATPDISLPLAGASAILGLGLRTASRAKPSLPSTVSTIRQSWPIQVPSPTSSASSMSIKPRAKARSKLPSPTILGGENREAPPSLVLTCPRGSVSLNSVQRTEKTSLACSSG